MYMHIQLVGVWGSKFDPRPLWAPLGPCGPPWALVSRALVGSLGSCGPPSSENTQWVRDPQGPHFPKIRGG